MIDITTIMANGKVGTSCHDLQRFGTACRTNSATLTECITHSPKRREKLKVARKTASDPYHWHCGTPTATHPLSVMDGNDFENRKKCCAILHKQMPVEQFDFTTQQCRFSVMPHLFWALVGAQLQCVLINFAVAYLAGSSWRNSRCCS